MDLSKYISKALSILSNDNITYNGSSYACVFNSQNNQDTKELGGMVPDKEFILTIDNTTNCPELKGQKVLFRGTQYRCIYERIGDYSKTITLVSIKK